MSKYRMIASAIGTAVLLTSCSMQDKRAQQDVAKPINCATAEGDIRVLQSEKAHCAKQIEAGVASVVPVALVINLVGGTEGKNIKVATGEYNKMLDRKIAEIRQTCDVR